MAFAHAGVESYPSAIDRYLLDNKRALVSFLDMSTPNHDLQEFIFLFLFKSKMSIEIRSNARMGY